MTTTENGVQQALISDPVKEKMAEEKVEMKETPETKENGKVENGTEEAKEAVTENGTPNKPPNKFRMFFTRDKSCEKVKKEAEDKEEKNGTTEVGEKEIVEKQVPVVKAGPRKWFQRKPAAQTATDAADAAEMTIGMNMLDRDEKGINDHIKLQFEDVFAEPDGIHSLDCAWRTTQRVFLGTRTFLYRAFTILLAIPLAIFWGLIYALLSVLNVWCCVPGARAIAIPATWIAKAWNFLVRCLLDPLFRSCGLCFGAVSIRHFNPAPPTPDVHVA